MKKILFTLVTALSLAANVFAAQAEENAAKLMVDDTAVRVYAFNINGYNYFKLRDIAYILNKTDCSFGVSWNKGSSCIVISKDESYKKTGKELKRCSDQNISIVASEQSIILNDKSVKMNTYNIQGNNYFKLRDLSRLIGFNTSYDEKDGIIKIDTKSPYVQEETVKPTKSAVENNSINQSSQNSSFVNNGGQQNNVINNTIINNNTVNNNYNQYNNLNEYNNSFNDNDDNKLSIENETVISTTASPNYSSDGSYHQKEEYKEFEHRSESNLKNNSLITEPAEEISSIEIKIESYDKNEFSTY